MCAGCVCVFFKILAVLGMEPRALKVSLPSSGGSQALYASFHTEEGEEHCASLHTSACHSMVVEAVAAWLCKALGTKTQLVPSFL